MVIFWGFKEGQYHGVGSFESMCGIEGENGEFLWRLDDGVIRLAQGLFFLLFRSGNLQLVLPVSFWADKVG